MYVQYNTPPVFVVVQCDYTTPCPMGESFSKKQKGESAYPYVGTYCTLMYV